MLSGQEMVWAYSTPPDVHRGDDCMKNNDKKRPSKMHNIITGYRKLSIMQRT